MSTSTKDIISFVTYMYNKFNAEESVKLFGGDISDKYSDGMWFWTCWNTSWNNNITNMVANISDEQLEIVVNRALECYDGRKNKL